MASVLLNYSIFSNVLIIYAVKVQIVLFKKKLLFNVSQHWIEHYFSFYRSKNENIHEKEKERSINIVKNKKEIWAII